ncbi:hypothetical protein ISE1_4398 [plant metagenome]|uniref:Uncharacterized protein n=1 Tax=plant metagenome TaxID=1297885 RepID=A0A484U8J2_9ZZZZ
MKGRTGSGDRAGHRTGHCRAHTPPSGAPLGAPKIETAGLCNINPPAHAPVTLWRKCAGLVSKSGRKARLL